MSKQAADQSCALEWAAQTLLPSTLCSNVSAKDSTGDAQSGQWMDPADCSLLVCHCNLVQQLHCQLQLPGLCQEHLDERLNHIWLTAQQVSEQQQSLTGVYRYVCQFAVCCMAGQHDMATKCAYECSQITLLEAWSRARRSVVSDKRVAMLCRSWNCWTCSSCRSKHNLPPLHACASSCWCCTNCGGCWKPCRQS